VRLDDGMWDASIPSRLTRVAGFAHAVMSVNKTTRVLQLALGSGLASAGAVLLSYSAFRLRFNLPTAGFFELLVVVVAALRLGFWEAACSAIVAVGCLDYFFAPPIYSFHVDDSENWVALAAFVITALIVSRLSNQVHDQMQQSLLHQRNAEKLYELSRSLLVLDRQQTAGPQIAALVKKHVAIDAVAIFDSSAAELYAAGSARKEDKESARSAYFLNQDHDAPERNMWERVLRVHANPVGAIVLSGAGLNSLMVDAITSLVASAFERARAFEKESRAEAARQTEQLRTTVLDGLAHAFKTPLTVILTSTSGLIEMKELSPAQAELVGLIDEQANKLNALTTHLLQMAKLESAEIRLCPQEVEITPFIRQLIDDCVDQLCGHEVELRVEDDDLTVSGDCQLLAIAITELIVNAAKYAGAHSPIVVSAKAENDHVIISVHNNGPVIEFAERERIFDRFYRSPATKHRASGSGIGLSVAKKAAEAHKGELWVSSSQEAGTTFFLSLPALVRRNYASVAE
jgi:two-component system, OmpR family, sensor histidine kinase KdpD